MTEEILLGKQLATGRLTMTFNALSPDLTTKAGLNTFYLNDKTEVGNIFFYDETGVVFKVPRGWLSKKYYGNNYYNSLKFSGGIKGKRVIKFDSKETFYIHTGKNYSNTKCVDVYVHMDALDGYGWQLIKTVKESEYATVTEKYVYVGGECNETSHLFAIYIDSTTEKHWDKKRLALLHELCTNTTTEEEFKAVLKQFDIRL